ncbi:DMT family transporter [Brevibacterium sediminis]|uniref:DMT family transporter n=1 Tax=Brevibacterium sediminis TaxID=1857024 RepID=UPI002174FE38|nr:DMT family transporter [Brevibacterium sediminis]MCS4592245.1 DMT family transporter [Brevibacterium sediminis]
MTFSVLGLVLIASVAHAVWNLAAKSVTGKGFAFVLAYHGLSAILLAPLAIVIIATGGQSLNWGLVGAAALSAVFHIAYSVALQSGYDHAPLGVVYPTARGTGPVVTIIIAVAFLGERPTLAEAAGAFTVIAGIAVVTIRPRGGVGPTSSHGLRRGLAWGGLIGAFIASYTLWDDFAVNHVSDSPLLYFAVSEACVGLIMTAGAFALPGGREKRADLREILTSHKRALVTVAILSPLAYVLVLYAMQQAPVALVAPVRETSIIVGTLLAWWFFGERNVVLKLAGALIVVLGIGLIALG